MRIPKSWISIAMSMTFLLAGVAVADAPGWVHDAPIEFITVQPNSRMYVKLKVAVPDLNCPGNAFGYLEFDTDAPHFKEQYALILAAHMAGKTITVYVGECGHYPYIQNTRVK